MADDEFPQLNPEEEMFMEDSAKRIRNEGQTKNKGTLVLTDQRLIFGRKTSFISKTKTLVDIPLNKVEKIDTVGLIGKQLVIGYNGKNRAGQSEYKKEFYKVSDLDDWVAKLEELTQ